MKRNLVVHAVRGACVGAIACAVVAACGKEKPNPASDPNAPAVVKAPPVVLPSDTARKPVPPVVEENVLLTTLSRDYALVGAGLTMRDPKLLASFYAPTATLTTPSGTVIGVDAILKEYKNLGADGTVTDYNRQSMTRKIVDSTVVDSGVYWVARKARDGAAVQERGAYAAVWRIMPPPGDWVMTKDHLYPLKPQKPAK